MGERMRKRPRRDDEASFCSVSAAVGRPRQACSTIAAIIVARPPVIAARPLPVAIGPLAIAAVAASDDDIEPGGIDVVTMSSIAAVPPVISPMAATVHPVCAPVIVEFPARIDAMLDVNEQSVLGNAVGKGHRGSGCCGIDRQQHSNGASCSGDKRLGRNAPPSASQRCRATA